MTYQGKETVTPEDLTRRRVERAFKRELHQTKLPRISRVARKEVRRILAELSEAGLYTRDIPKGYRYR